MHHKLLLLAIPAVLVSLHATAASQTEDEARRTDRWPEQRPAPEEWIVKDKYGQFASWWTGPGDEKARAALRHAMRRETLGLSNEFTAALRLLPTLANSIRWEHPLAGAQQSHLYRSRPDKHTAWDRPGNARLMECVTLLAHFYSINQPWNPYHHDTALGKRLVAALEYWLSLQTPEGGFPEYAGFGANELPSTAFVLMSMAETYQTLKDEPLFAGLAPRWLDAMGQAVRWGAGSAKARTQGASHANQFLGIIAGAWHLHAFTGEPRWKTLYDELTDWWLANAQADAGWYREHGGREDFAYSGVTDLYVDRLAIESGDPRWLESLRRACLASQQIVVFEMDLKTTVMDTTGHARTTPAGSLNLKNSSRNPQSSGHPYPRYTGWFNHVATRLPEARAFAIGFPSKEEAAKREKAWFDAWPACLSWTHAFPQIRGANGGAFGWDGDGACWPLPAGSQTGAATQTRPWKETRYTDVSIDPKDNQELTCVRRPGYYATFRTGVANGKQTVGVGVMWLPGFGTVFASSNAAPKPAFGWKATGSELAKTVPGLRLDWGESAPPDTASQLTLRGRPDLPPLHFELGEDALVLRAKLPALHLPLVSRAGEKWTLADGSAWDGRAPVTTASLRLRRDGENVTHDALIDFGGSVRLSPSSPTGLGVVLKVRTVTVTPGTKGGDLSLTLRRIAR
ncbi:MAG: hypothetical protein LBK99_02965 [Opitutaceae bacterium]|jgi:hypothetical protein|nr:hypothetical protein [Opitutaceae bacterium]